MLCQENRGLVPKNLQGRSHPSNLCIPAPSALTEGPGGVEGGSQSPTSTWVYVLRGMGLHCPFKVRGPAEAQLVRSEAGGQPFPDSRASVP